MGEICCRKELSLWRLTVFTDITDINKSQLLDAPPTAYHLVRGVADLLYRESVFQYRKFCKIAETWWCRSLPEDSEDSTEDPSCVVGPSEICRHRAIRDPVSLWRASLGERCRGASYQSSSTC
ncbi:hypothetical protein AVEN_3457-1 [Araneus ventricosus]|uniref:Uncharacterized protein n=1 Tax=Araneus ventricosus TaxID=182803 RepID=A0A4Y2VV57_ARAVE|nr:hypothetical protein AVEN_3457-1 [Araneus ventricosus]